MKFFFKKANTLCSIYIHALVIIGILTALGYVMCIIFITLKLWSTLSTIKKKRTNVEPLTPQSKKNQEKGNSRPQQIVITVSPPSLQDFNQNTEIRNENNKTKEEQKLQAHEAARSSAQPKNCQIDSNQLHGVAKELRKQPRFHNSGFKELDVVKLSDLGGIHILRKQSYVSYDGNPLEI